MLSDFGPNKKGNWDGVIFSVIFTIIGNIFFPIFIFLLMNSKSGETRTSIINTSMAIGFFLSNLFNMVLVLFGFLSKHFNVVKIRLKEYREERRLDKKLAKKWYKQNLKYEGWAFWIFLVIMITSLILFIVYFSRILPQLIASI